MTAKEELQAVLEIVSHEFSDEVDNLLVLNVRGIQVLRWAYQSPYCGLDAVDDVIDSVGIFLETVGEFITEQGLLLAAEATDDFGIVDYVANEEDLKAYSKVYEELWDGVN